MHGGHPTSSGARYILVAFCTVDPAYSEWATRFYERVREVIDPDPDPGPDPGPDPAEQDRADEGAGGHQERGGGTHHEPSRAIPCGLLTGGPLYREALQAVRG